MFEKFKGSNRTWISKSWHMRQRERESSGKSEQPFTASQFDEVKNHYAIIVLGPREERESKKGGAVRET